MNKYQKLTRNTLIFFLGDTGSKIAAFFMLRYYTSVLTTSDYGIVDLIITTASLLMPTITLAINEGVFRFSMDKGIDRSKVLTIGIFITLAGNLILLLLISTVRLSYAFWDFKALIWLVCITSGVKEIIANYCRGIERTKLYAASGVIQSVLQIVAAVVLMSVLHLQVQGYIYATALASTLTAAIIAIVIRKDFRFRLRIDKALCKRMLAYSIPLIAHLIFWWAMSAIDRYVILAQLSTSDNGIYSAASKVPLLITTVSAVFFKAWQLSSVDESKSADKEAFYNKIFQLLHITLVMTSMILLILVRPIYSILVGAAFEGCWQYTPFLIVSVIFSIFSSFLGTNYLAMMETKGAVYTSGAAAAVNLVLNILLTKQWGINGTAFATMISFIFLWLIRRYSTAKYVKIRIEYPKFIATYLLLMVQAFIIASGASLYYVQALLIALVVWMNFKDIAQIAKKLIYHLRPAR
jgi:O-antigen/teichoic acid export membrane protein